MRRTVAGHPGIVVSVALLVLLEGGYLVLRPQAPDLPAQLARASAVSRGVELWWAGWYGGINTSTYSLLSAHLMNALGVACVGLASTAAVCVLGADLVRHSVRPRAGAAAVALAACANLYSGRITFAAGMAVVLGSFCCLRRELDARALLLGAVVGLISPLAALCQVVGLTAMVLSTGARRRVHLLAVGVTVAPVALVSLVFGQPSYMPFSADICLYALLACAGVLLAPVPRQIRALAVVSAALAVGAYLVHSPVGSNATRMPMLAAAPLVVATARRGAMSRRGVVLAAALVIWPLSSLTSDMAIAAGPSSQADFYAPLLRQLPRVGASTQRVEVLDPLTHGAAYYLSTQVPLARGWERQIDAAQNPLFYRRRLAADSYRGWLDQRAVGWVAVPLVPELDYGSVPEGVLVAGGLPYLHLTWSNPHWRLYRVDAPAPVADGTLTATSLTDTAVDLRATGRGAGVVKVPYSRLLVVRSMRDPAVLGCVQPDPDGDSLVSVPAAGRYALSSELSALTSHCSGPPGPAAGAHAGRAG